MAFGLLRDDSISERTGAKGVAGDRGDETDDRRSDREGVLTRLWPEFLLNAERPEADQEESADCSELRKKDDVMRAFAGGVHPRSDREESEDDDCDILEKLHGEPRWFCLKQPYHQEVLFQDRLLFRKHSRKISVNDVAPRGRPGREWRRCDVVLTLTGYAYARSS